ncbi:unnamed protein product [Rhizophagus irregularis]|nr:unnamed protein product [Rhizophagus irregularis]
MIWTFSRKKYSILIEHEADSINRKHWITSVISKYRTFRFFNNEIAHYEYILTILHAITHEERTSCVVVSRRASNIKMPLGSLRILLLNVKCLSNQREDERLFREIRLSYGIVAMAFSSFISQIAYRTSNIST